MNYAQRNLSRLLALAPVIASLGCFLFVLSCEASIQARDVYVLLDVSGSYFPRLVRNTRDFRALVTPLAADDTFTIAHIQSCSFTDDARILDFRMETRQQERNEQKRRILSYIRDDLPRAQKTTHTDITGAIYLASEYLRPSHSTRKAIVILSDMLEQLPSDCPRAWDLAESTLSGITIIISNVGKSEEDNSNIDAYFERLNRWNARFTAAGAKNVHIVTSLTQAVEILDRL